MPPYILYEAHLLASLAGEDGSWDIYRTRSYLGLLLWPRINQRISRMANVI